jgi:hypothetical protein
MCLSPGAYAGARVYERLVSRGVPSARAAGVARKVTRAYELKRRDLAASAYASGDRSDAHRGVTR